MSTTFGIRINSINKVVVVARRHGIGNGNIQITILNPLLYKVNGNVPVIAMDNTQQGIEKVADLMKCSNIINGFE